MQRYDSLSAKDFGEEQLRWLKEMCEQEEAERKALQEKALQSARVKMQLA